MERNCLKRFQLLHSFVYHSNSFNRSLMDSIYLGQWYEYDTVSKKTLLVLMERSKKPMIVTAGKIINLSLETFTL
ncbi:7tm 6 domain containing protein, partial [Asbolus verrucosus]